MHTKVECRFPLLAIVVALGSLTGVVRADCPTYEWTYTAGDPQSQFAFSVAVNDLADVFVAGLFRGIVDFDPTGPGDIRTSVGSEDAFVVKRNPDGSHAWTWAVGGEDLDRSGAMTLDPFGDVLIAGTYNFLASGSNPSPVDFDPDGQGDPHPGGNSFVTKLHADGTYGWTRTFRTTRTRGFLTDGQSLGVATDSAGNVFVVGIYRFATDFDPDGLGDIHFPLGNFRDGFVTKLGPDGSYHWTATFGGAEGFVGPFSVTTDASGNVYIASDFRGTVDFDPGVGEDLHSTDDQRGHAVTKLRNDGTYAWTRSVSPANANATTEIAFSPEGYVISVSDFSGTTDFDPTAGVDLHHSEGIDAFVQALNPDGSYRWTRTFGSGLTQAFGTTVNSAGDFFVAGGFFGTGDFDPGPGVALHTSNGEMDAYLSKFRADGSHVWTHTVGSEANDQAQTVAVNGLGAFAVAGVFLGTMDFDPGPGKDIRASAGRGDFYVTKWSNRCAGDMNCDNRFNGADIDPFFLALGDPVAWHAAFPNCDILNGDMNRDGELNGADIDVFFLCLGGRCP